MADGNLLKVYYERIESSDEVILTETNCESYGYVSTTIEENGVEYTVYYKSDDETKTPILYEIIDGEAVTTILVHTYKMYEHIAPPCSKYSVSYADVDKSGTGRNELTGEMYRERLGHYTKISLTWDLIPNTKEYNNWYKILTHLPPYFYAELLLPSGEIETKKLYRGDVSTELHLFVADLQIWRGLSTSFIEWDVNPYNDNVEPELEL